MIRGHEVASLIGLHPHVPADVTFSKVLARKHGVYTRDLASLAPRSRTAGDPPEYTAPGVQSVVFSIGGSQDDAARPRKRLKRADEIERGIAMESVNLAQINARTEHRFVQTKREYKREISTLPGVCLGGKIDGVGANRVPIELKSRTRKFGVAVYDAIQLHVYMYAMGAQRGYVGETLDGQCRLTLIPFDQTLWDRVCAALAKIKEQLQTSRPTIVETAKRIARGQKQLGDAQTMQKFLGQPG